MKEIFIRIFWLNIKYVLYLLLKVKTRLKRSDGKFIRLGKKKFFKKRYGSSNISDSSECRSMSVKISVKRLPKSRRICKLFETYRGVLNFYFSIKEDRTLDEGRTKRI